MYQNKVIRGYSECNMPSVKSVLMGERNDVYKQRKNSPSVIR